MTSPDRIRRRANTAFAAVFVPVFLGAILIQNLAGFLRRDLPLREEAAVLLRALGAEQRWPMFGAYFPNHTRVPVVRLVLADGTPLFLLPVAAPTFSDELVEDFDLESTSPAGRIATWRTHVNSGRLEKFESRASSPAPRWIGVRTAYAASRIRRWAEAKGLDPSKKVRAVDLLSVKIQSARGGAPLTVVSVDALPIAPLSLPNWPAPRARQLLGRQR